LLWCWRLFRQWWWFFGSCAFFAMLVSVVYTKFIPKEYRAIALLRPISNSQNQIFTAAGEEPLQSLFFGVGQSEAKSQEYISILYSFAFTTALIKDHNLKDELTHHYRGPRAISDWKLYRGLAASFTAEYDRKTGNLKLAFESTDPAQARRILGFYIDSLRERLRGETVNRASVAIATLESELGKTGDALLRNQFYDLIAHQIDRQKLAEVQADFAFSVIEPPVVPEQPFRPRRRLDALLAGLFALVFVVIVVSIYEAVRGAQLVSRRIDERLPEQSGIRSEGEYL
jgi:uncharacterized protein involved in exopolysaccharide biosynthesis